MSRSSAGISALQTAEALADAAAIVTRRMPAPRGLPFYGLDHPPGALDRMLATLSDLGIFRVYSHVLDLSGGLGGPARWLARRHACRVSLVGADRDLAGASALLTARAFLVERVSTIRAEPARLPFADEVFTHAWQIAVGTGGGERSQVFAEAWRTLRPGGWLAVAANVSLDSLTADVDAAGFRDPAALDLEPSFEDDSTAARLTKERTATALGVAADAAFLDRSRTPLVGLRARKPS